MVNPAQPEPHQLDGPETALPVFSPTCSACRHWDSRNPAQPGLCSAFPAGIPKPIWLGEDDHTAPWPGDKGILFERAQI